MIELIVMVGVIGNFILQTIWFIWTLKNHSHKHIENNPETFETPKEEMCTNSIRDYQPIPKSRDEVFGAERRYDPNKIKGVFDGVFDDKVD